MCNDRWDDPCQVLALWLPERQHKRPSAHSIVIPTPYGALAVETVIRYPGTWDREWTPRLPVLAIQVACGRPKSSVRRSTG